MTWALTSLILPARIRLSLRSIGMAAIVCFPGIMYRGGAEQKIRKYHINNTYAGCVIRLPANLFFGASIAICIIIPKKHM